ncbi:MAG: response regulator [Oscillospiraceae bacterium]|nr:response regulator [Oscillospiraceae bacterium]
MLNRIVYLMIYAGSALMVYNIIGFVRFARYIKQLRSWKRGNGILYFPIVLLVLFLLGYLAVGIFGKPDLIVAGILFGGSVFVFIMYKLLSGIIQRILESEQIEARLIAAEESNRAKASFLASISHEMRTPMNIILGLDGMALKNQNLEPETRAQLEKIGFSARHLLDMINNILDLNSMETGDFSVKNESFSFGELLDQVNVIAEAQCGEKGLEYNFSVPPFSNVRVMGDEMRIKQALLHIIDNAVKYTEAPGSVALSVDRVLNAEKGMSFRFTVTDTGEGIDSEFLPHIFDAFSREDQSSTSSHGGSGLGLAETKGVVEQMGGEITAQSKKNEGSVFTVILPLKLVQESEIVTENGDTNSLSLAGRHVLIAEDIPMNAEVVTSILELEEVQSDCAENGQLALDKFRQSKPFYYDAILMDLRMPIMDGLEATRRIRALDRRDAKLVPIIALTANASESDVRQSMDAGMDLHLAKPVDAETLFATLRRLISEAERRG